MFEAILSFLQIAILTAAPVLYMVARSTSRTRPLVSAICATASFCSALGSLCVLAISSFFAILGDEGDTFILLCGLAVIAIVFLIADIRLIIKAVRTTRSPAPPTPPAPPPT